MIYPANNLVKKMSGTAGLAALLILVSGCQTTFRTVDERFMAQPATHRQVQILPAWFEGAGNIDHTLTTNELQALCQRAGNDLVNAVQTELQAKGYRVIGPAQIWRTNEMPGWLVAEVGPPLEVVRIDFCKNLLGQFPVTAAGESLAVRTNTTRGFVRYMATANPARLEHNPFHYQMTSSLTNVLARYGGTNAQAILLVDSKVFFESPHYEAKRTLWNFTGGGLLATTEVGVNLAVIAVAVLSGAGSAPVPIWVDPFWHSSNSLQHSIALVDARTCEVLWLNRRDFKRKDPRDAAALAETVAETIADLPSLRSN